MIIPKIISIFKKFPLIVISVYSIIMYIHRSLSAMSVSKYMLACFTAVICRGVTNGISTVGKANWAVEWASKQP